MTSVLRGFALVSNCDGGRGRPPLASRSLVQASPGRAAVTRQGAASAASPQGLTASATDNRLRSAGADAVRPADLAASFAVFGGGEASGWPGYLTGHFPPISADSADAVVRHEASALASYRTSNSVAVQGRRDREAGIQARSARAKTKNGKDAGSANGSAIHVSEDAARRRFAAVRAEAESTARDRVVPPIPHPLTTPPQRGKGQGNRPAAHRARKSPATPYTPLMAIAPRARQSQPTTSQGAKVNATHSTHVQGSRSPGKRLRLGAHPSTTNPCVS